MRAADKRNGISLQAQCVQLMSSHNDYGDPVVFEMVVQSLYDIAKQRIV